MLWRCPPYRSPTRRQAALSASSPVTINKSCNCVASEYILQSTSINGIKLMFNENEMKILFCCCSGTSETSEMNASEECGGVVGIGQSGHLHYTPVTIAVWPPPVTPTKKIKKPI